jgi:hypothetical protein
MEETLTFDPVGQGFDLSSVFGTSLSLGADASYNTPRLSETQVSNGLQLLQPVAGAADQNGWSGFWQDTIKTIVGGAVALQAAKAGQAGAVQQQAAAGVPVYRQVQVPNIANPAVSSNMLTFAVVGGLVWLAVKG